MSKRKERAWRSLAQELIKALDPNISANKKFKGGFRYFPNNSKEPQLSKTRAWLFTSSLEEFKSIQGADGKDQSPNIERGLLS